MHQNPDEDKQSTIPQSGRNDLMKERQAGTFNVREMTYFIDGSPELTHKMERMMLEFERDFTFKIDDLADIPKDQLRERVMTRAKNLTNYVKRESVDDFRLRFRVLSLIDPGFMTRMGVHYALFMGALSGSGTKEQLEYWVGKGAMTLNGVIGCFGMTEMGHGSNVAAVETTATFDKETDEFIIHTPTLTATKWWIGGAAQSSTHSVVFARLIVDGKDYGTKSFVVPLRNVETFKTLPGINIGDMGMKMGRNAIDNGWIQFTNVRIPRSYMLMKHAKVTANGNVIEPHFQQLAYGALVFGRMSMIRESCDALKKALTIAIRYSAVRRQFSSGPSKMETPILNYQTHQIRLFPLLAATFALNFAGRAVNDAFDINMSLLEKAKPSDPNIKVVVDSLKETHGTTAGLKAFSTWLAIDGIEKCRQCLGGNGYSSYSALPGMLMDFTVQCTWEGDNTVLTLQAGRYLIGCYKEWSSGGKLPQGVDYLNKLPEILYIQCGANPCDMDEISTSFDVVRANLVQKAYEDYMAAKQLKDSSEEQCLEACALSRSEAAKFHCYGLMYQKFLQAIKTAPNHLTAVLGDLCLLYGLHTIKENSGQFLLCGFFNRNQIKAISEMIIVLLSRIRPQAVLLVDSFNLTDYVINTPLGKYKGDVYTDLFEHVKLNNPQGEHKYFERILKPLVTKSQSSADHFDQLRVSF